MHTNEAERSYGIQILESQKRQKAPKWTPSSSALIESIGLASSARNALDIEAIDAEIAELAVVESVELTDGLLILSELSKFLADVHFNFPFCLVTYI